MHEFFDNIVENPLPGISLIESVHIFIQVGMKMLGRAFVMDAPEPRAFFEVKKQTETRRDHKHLLLNSE